MSKVASVGLVGCGAIAPVYVDGSAAFDTFEIVACADLDSASAQTFAETHGLRACAVDELVSDVEVDVILNLTPPSAHATVIRAAVGAGKTVYTEKPLATSVADGGALVEEATQQGVRVGCAPDTFVGSAYEAGRDLILRGAIGKPIGATAMILSAGPDAWHPNADLFYRAGAGPMLDLGPYYLTALVALLGPVEAAVGFSATPTPTRSLGVGPRAGETFTADVPTHVVGALQMESGAIATVTVSFEARGGSESGLVVYGTDGSLELPDANAFGGDVRVRNGNGEWSLVPYASRGAQDTRGLGLHEMLEAIRDDRPHRASAALGLHVLESATAILTAGVEGRAVHVATLVDGDGTSPRR
jgi:predicted dehydrogenase